MSLPAARPRLAIVGGGGAMGRCFARLLSGAAREVYLLDFFAADTRPASLSLALAELRAAGERCGLNGWLAGAVSSDSPTAEVVRWRPTTGDVRGERALARLDRRSTPRSGELAEPIEASSVAALLDGFAGDDAPGYTIYAGPPGDAPLLLPRADVILLAVGFENDAAFGEIVRSYAPWFRPGSLVVDLGSTKTQPMATLCREIDRSVGVLGAHPLFSPTVTELAGLIVAVVDPDDGRSPSPWREWFLGQLAGLRMIVTPTTAGEHDDAMAFVQALTHFALLAYAYTFVRLDCDPIDLLALRTPVFEPLLYLAARVAYLARATPETYRSIQAFSTRPDARHAFIEAAREVLAAIEQTVSEARPPAEADGADPLTALFRRYGAPWAPDGRDRRERQRREHLLEMGAHLVDDLNRVRQEVVAAVGQVRAVEERRPGQAPRVVVGLVHLDLLAPGKSDVTSRIRLRRLNLPLGSVQGEGRDPSASGDDASLDQVVPLARARLLSDAELIEWLDRTGQLVEKRTFPLVVPRWFDGPILQRLLRGFPAVSGSCIWRVDLEPITGEAAPEGQQVAWVTLSIVVHPAELVAARTTIQRASDTAYRERLQRLDAELAAVRRRIEEATDAADRLALAREKDRLKHERKAQIDRRTAEVDREVRRAARARVQEICERAIAWLLERGCSRGARSRPPEEGNRGGERFGQPEEAQ